MTVTAADLFCGAGVSGLGFETAEDIDACLFRMFSLDEIADAMVMGQHVDGSALVVLGNKRERMAQYGQAITPPAMALLVSRLLEVLDA
jgi:DNA (cytosine-5)-methyltransferase 1